MESFIELSLQNFCSTHDIFEKPSVYVNFEKKPEIKGKQYGFNSKVMFGQIVYKNQQDERKKSVPLVLKNSIPKSIYQDYIHMQYFNEIYFYTRALPLLQTLGNLQTLLPRYYDSYIHCGTQNTKVILISEDLQPQGFREHERFSFLDLDHLTMMVHRLGQFHSYSYFAKSRNVQEFNALGHWFKYAQAELIRERPNHFHLFSQIGLQRLRQDPCYSAHIERVEKMLEKADEFAMQINTMEQEEPMSVLCHGDYLRGNVMFRYENGQPVDMKMIDMATCRIASPVMDLSLVLYLNADQRTRSQHWNHLIDAYYEGLCQIFGGVGVPSKESILKEFTNKAVYGYLIASHFLPSLIDMDRGSITCFLDYIPQEFVGCPFREVPEDVYKDSIKRWCSVEDARAETLADILRDLIDRRFI